MPSIPLIRGPDRTTTLHPAQAKLAHDDKPSRDGTPSMRAHPLPAWQLSHTLNDVIRATPFYHAVQH
eukprot:12764028-Alexandrium_andersonii.AAC.1